MHLVYDMATGGLPIIEPTPFDTTSAYNKMMVEWRGYHGMRKFGCSSLNQIVDKLSIEEVSDS